MEPQHAPPHPSDTATTLVRMLWGHSDRARLLPADQPVPSGWRGVESFLVFPGLAAPSFLMPARVTPAAQSSLLSSYNNLRYFGARMTRSAVAAAVRFPTVSARLGDRANVIVPEEECHDSLHDVVAARMRVSRDEIVLAVPVRRGAGGVRPTVTVARPDGTPVAFVKVGRRAIHRRRLMNEHASLQDLTRSPVTGLRTPTPLWNFEWQGRQVIGAAPLPIKAHRVGLHRAPRAWHYAESLHASRPVDSVRLGDSVWMANLRTRASSAPADQARPLLSTLDDLAAQHGARQFTMGRTHGDWLPWNLGWDVDGTLLAWDWETSQDQAPLLIDALQWTFGMTTMYRGRPIREGVEDLRRGAISDPDRSGGVLSVFLAEQAVRRAEECTPGCGPEVDLAGQALAALRNSL